VLTCLATGHITTNLFTNLEQMLTSLRTWKMLTNQQYLVVLSSFPLDQAAKRVKREIEKTTFNTILRTVILTTCMEVGTTSFKMLESTGRNPLKPLKVRTRELSTWTSTCW